mmetsp:Transcript_10839/g.21193  ORF Transcript_10839/g.21193 Transcript_10839/m.21193 type:complete len:205 (+) Transcript_10839:455-1069(+)
MDSAALHKFGIIFQQSQRRGTPVGVKLFWGVGFLRISRDTPEVQLSKEVDLFFEGLEVRNLAVPQEADHLHEGLAISIDKCFPLMSAYWVASAEHRRKCRVWVLHQRCLGSRDEVRASDVDLNDAVFRRVERLSSCLAFFPLGFLSRQLVPFTFLFSFKLRPLGLKSQLAFVDKILLRCDEPGELVKQRFHMSLKTGHRGGILE